MADQFDDYEVDPAAEFLAREQTQLAGLEEDLNGVVQQSSPTPILNGDSSPPNGMCTFSGSNLPSLMIGSNCIFLGRRFRI